MEYTPLLKLALPPFDEVPWDEAINGNTSILDAAVGRFFSVPDLAGVWKNSTIYTSGQAVIDSADSTMWTCVIGHGSSAAPATFAQDRITYPSLWMQISATAQDYALSAAASATEAAASAAAAEAAVSGTFAGDVTATGYNLTTSGAAWRGDATTTDFFMDGAGWVWRYTRATGRLSYLRGGDALELFAIAGDGNVSAAGALIADTLIVDANMVIGAGGTGRIMQMGPSWYWDWSIATGQLTWTGVGGGMWVMRPSDGLCYSALGPTGGNGAYVNVSDERVKVNIGMVSCGMDAVRQLHPISFQRKDKDRQEFGFSAQQVREVIPQAVVEFEVDKEDPLLAVTAETLLAVAWNAIKELDARVRELENK